MRLAVLDIGTNTVLLLIVDAEKDGTLRVLRDDHAIARLGEGVDRTHAISEAAYSRFREVMRTHCDVIRAFHVERIVAVGTSALRDAGNRDEIIRRARADTGTQIEILSGEDEARWTYRGALFGMRFPENAQENTVGVIDIGGGSTEISIGNGQEFLSGVSLNIGAVRLTERYFSSMPITAEAEKEARRMIQEKLAESVPMKKTEQLIAVAGTPTTLAAMDQRLEEFDAANVQDYILTRAAIDSLLDLLLTTPTSHVMQVYPAVHKARADILPAGTLILREAMEFLGVDNVRVSAHGLRYGIAIREFAW